MKARLPLFPLNAVLFPRTQLPLRVFEQRYKDMIGDCLQRRAPFGVSLIQEGPESGGVALPFETGCEAEIKKVTTLDNGDLKVTVGSYTSGTRSGSLGIWPV